MTQILIVDDEASIRRLGQWPWPRTDMATLTRRLGQAGARVVAFDAAAYEKDAGVTDNAARPAGLAAVGLRERIVQRFYGTGPSGLVGNDDVGQMSAWLVFAMLGFYPAEPFSGRYALGQPLVRGAELDLPQGRRLRITGRGPGGRNGHCSAT